LESNLELEEGEIPQVLPTDNSVTNGKKHRNFLTRSRRTAVRKALWELANSQSLRLTRLSQELAVECAASSDLRSSLKDEQHRNSQLAAELRTTEWKLTSTERKLYVTRKPFPKERVLHFLKTALPPDVDDIPFQAPGRT
jgi:hypothetical protein